MKKIRRCTRILILYSLAVSVLIPIVLLSGRLKNLSSDAPKVFIEDLTSIKHRKDAVKLNTIEQEEGIGFKGPTLVVYKDRDFNSVVSDSSFDKNIKSQESGNAKGGNNISIMSERNGTDQDAKEENQQGKVSFTYRGKQENSKQRTVRHDQNVQSQTRRVLDEKVNEMKDQLIRAKLYLNFAAAHSTSQLVKELKIRIKEVERAVGESIRHSDLSKRALQRMKSMEVTLLKASRVYTDCPAMAGKLRAMTYNAEEQVRAQKNEVTFLAQLAGRTTPKGLYCLSMRLTAEYFALQPNERELPNQHKLHDLNLYHFAIFSDNVLACAAVVSSTISSAMEPQRLVFHVVTDYLNLPAISMWFLLNPPGKATIQVQSIDTFEWLSTKYGATLQKQNSHDPRFTSALNQLRFYLPDVFPMLNKILFLDHDVVVQRDVTGLWNIDMKGKVNGAVETCREGEPSFHKTYMFINFSDPMVAKRFHGKACTWAFGMNIFDLQEWRRQNLTGLYHKYLQLDVARIVGEGILAICHNYLSGSKRPLWKAGSLPLGWVTFYNQTVALDRRWHVLGLGRDTGVRHGDIEQAAVIHYDGIMKPWLDDGIEKYRDYWRKHVKYEHPHLQQCNIHR